MGEFYSEMAAMARSVLAQTDAGGLGQRGIVLRRETMPAPNPQAPWEPVTPVVTTENLDAVARGVDAQLVGTDAGGSIVVASDLVVTTAPPAMGIWAGDRLIIDGAPATILSVARIPAAGVVAAMRLIVRRGVAGG